MGDWRDEQGGRDGLADGGAWLIVRQTGVEVRVRLSPKSSRNRVDGLYGDRLKVRLTAPPVDGRANEALIRFLAKAAGLPPSCGRIVAGARNRSKTVLLETDVAKTVAARLRSTLAPSV